METIHDSDNEYNPGGEIPVERLYIFAEIADDSERYSSILTSPGFTEAYKSGKFSQYRNCQIEILQEFKTCANKLIVKIKVPIARIIGVGLNSEKEYIVCYDLTNPDNPVEILGTESIIEAIGANRIAKIKADDFFFPFGDDSY